MRTHGVDLVFLTAVSAICVFGASFDARAQNMIVVNPVFDTIDVRDESGNHIANIDTVDQVRYSATDGATSFWVSDEGAQSLRRFTFDGLDEIVTPVPGVPRALSVTANGQCAAIVRDGFDSSLLFVDASGVIVDDWPLGPHPELLARGIDGSFWIAEFVGTAPGVLRRFSRNGALIGLHPIGASPTRLLKGRDHDFWILCGISQELWHYTQNGDLAAVHSIGVGARDLAQDRFGQLVIAYPGTGMIEYRASDGTPGWTTFGPDVTQFLRDQEGGLWAVDAQNGVLVPEADWSLPGHPGFPLVPGAGVPGSEDAMTFAAAGGHLIDSDADGSSNGDEVNLGTRPFDASSSPFGWEVLAPLRTGETAHYRFRSLATPNTLFVTGLSHAPADAALMPSGFSLAPGPLFDWYANHASPSIVNSIFGFFDPFGETDFQVVLPDDAGLVGARFWMAFRALTAFPDLLCGLASPAWEFEILE